MLHQVCPFLQRTGLTRVGQNHIYSVYMVLLAGNYQIYVQNRCVYTVLANPRLDVWACKHVGVGVGEQCAQGCSMTVLRYGPSKYGLKVDAVNEGVRPSSRNLGTIMMVHGGTIVNDDTVQKSQKGQKLAFDPKMTILTFFSSFLNVACVIFLNVACVIFPNVPCVIILNVACVILLNVACVIYLNVACVIFVHTNDWCNNERKRKGKQLAKIVCLDQDLNPCLTFHSKTALDDGFTQ